MGQHRPIREFGGLERVILGKGWANQLPEKAPDGQSRRLDAANGSRPPTARLPHYTGRIGAAGDRARRPNPPQAAPVAHNGPHRTPTSRRGAVPGFMPLKRSERLPGHAAVWGGEVFGGSPPRRAARSVAAPRWRRLPERRTASPRLKCMYCLSTVAEGKNSDCASVALRRRD
jgi:hypothetical protein